MNLKNLYKKAQQKLNIVDVAINLILLVALIPIIKIFSAGTRLCLNSSYPYLTQGICCNISSCVNTTLSSNISSTCSHSSTELLLLGLITLIIVLAFIFNLVKMTGLVKKK